MGPNHHNLIKSYLVITLHAIHLEGNASGKTLCCLWRVKHTHRILLNVELHQIPGIKRYCVNHKVNWSEAESICCCCLVAKSCPTLCNPMDCSTPGLPVPHTQSLLKLTSIEAVMPSNHLILCRPLLLLPSVFPSIRVFSKESVLRIRWPKYWSFSFNISLSSEYSGLISFKMAWLDLLAVQGTLKSLPQHHSSEASIPWCSAFFMVQLSHPYTTTGETTALTIQSESTWLCPWAVTVFWPQVNSRLCDGVSRGPRCGLREAKLFLLHENLAFG